MKLVLIIAALLGCATGATVVLADSPAPIRAPAVAAAAVTPAPRTPALHPADTRIAAQVADPQGGPAWALRAFTAGHGGECAELVRVVDGRYGWIDGHGTFTPATPGAHEAPTTCSSAQRLARFGAFPTRTTTVDRPASGTPRPSRTVTWGLAAPGVAKIDTGGATYAPQDGVYLAVTLPEDADVLSGTVTYADGRTKRFDHGLELPPQIETARPGTTHVGAEAPDPAGGQPWAILVAIGTKGDACRANPGRLLGTQFGTIDPSFDTLAPDFGHLACGFRMPTRGDPMRLEAGIWSASFPQDPTGTTERRVLPGRTTISGAVSADVVSVTIDTPHDVRTLIPSRDHLLLAVYDGTFPTGGVRATARLRDGRTFTRSVYVG